MIKADEDYLGILDRSTGDKNDIIAFLPRLRKNDTVLEVGPGGGNTLRRILAEIASLDAEVRPNVAVLDISVEVLKRVNTIFDEVNANLPEDEHIQFSSFTADISEKLPFDNESLSAINLSAVMHECFSYCGGEKGVNGLIKEMMRTLRSCGVVTYRDPDGVKLNKPSSTILLSETIRIFSVLFLKKYFDFRFTRQSNKPNIKYLERLKILIDGKDVDIDDLDVEKGINAADVTIEGDSGLIHELKRHFVVFCSTLIPESFFQEKYTDDGLIEVKFHIREGKGRFLSYCRDNGLSFEEIEGEQIRIKEEVFDKYREKLERDINDKFKATTLVFNTPADLERAMEMLNSKSIKYENGEESSLKIGIEELVLSYSYLMEMRADGLDMRIPDGANAISKWFEREGEESYFYGDHIDVIIRFFEESLSADEENSTLGYSCLIPLSADSNAFSSRDIYTNYINGSILDIDGGYVDGKRNIHFVKRPIELAVPILLDFYRRTGDRRLFDVLMKTASVMEERIKEIRSFSEREPFSGNYSPDGSVVVGLIGGIASGKTSAAEVFRNNGFEIIELSQIIREKIASQGVLNPTRTDYFETANKMRREDGKCVLAKIASERLKISGAKKVVISGIRTPHEANFLKEIFPHFKLIGIDAPIDLRIQRIQNRLREIDSTDIGKAIDDISREWEDVEDGCQLGATMKLCDTHVDGGTPLSVMQAEFLEIINQLS